MGSQEDGLRGMTRFSDNEGDIIWPAWRAELKQRISFEFGKIGNQIIEGEVTESDVDERLVTENINALINALIPKTRAQIQTCSDYTALLASIAITAVRGGSCPAACHASRHASIVPHFVAELHAPLENGASKFNNASRVISSMSIPVPPLPASSAATSAFCATSTTRSILFCCACKACLTKRVARTKNRVPCVARYY